MRNIYIIISAFILAWLIGIFVTYTLINCQLANNLYKIEINSNNTYSSISQTDYNNIARNNLYLSNNDNVILPQ